MKILILTSGSRGDVQPYVALGKGLKNLGHEIFICTHVHFKPFIEAEGLSYAFVNDDMIQFMHSDLGKEVMENMTNVFKILFLAFRLRKMIKNMEEQIIRDSWQACKSIEPEMIIYHPKTYCALHFAEKLHVPSVLTLFQPIYGKTKEFAAAGFPQWRLGGCYNAFTFWLIEKLSNLLTRKFSNQWRKNHDLPPLKRGHSFLKNSQGKNIPIVYGVNTSMIRAAKEWKELDVHVSGAWVITQEAGWMPDVKLLDFLSDGPAPIYFGFGSMMGKNPERLGVLIVEALKNLGMRGVLSRGWGGISAKDLPENMIQIDMVPHSWLFPKMKAIVHHGGAGTSHAAMLAGKPQIICPFVADQPYWGWRIHQLGLGPRPIPQKKLTAQNLEKALQAVLSDGRMEARAEEMGQKLMQEDGISFMNQFLSGIKP